MITTTNRTKLMELCCVVIAKNKELYNIDELQRVLPEELFEACFNMKTCVIPLSDNEEL